MLDQHHHLARTHFVLSRRVDAGVVEGLELGKVAIVNVGLLTTLCFERDSFFLTWSTSKQVADDLSIASCNKLSCAKETSIVRDLVVEAGQPTTGSEMVEVIAWVNRAIYALNDGS